MPVRLLPTDSPCGAPGRGTAPGVPRFSDVPDIDVVLVSRPDIPPAGAGETPLIAVAPAVANAIFAATGRRLRSPPLIAGGCLPGTG